MARIMAIPLEDKIFYPESDGEPMAETEEHLEEVVYAWQALKDRFEAEADVFVGADLFLYYREGDPGGVVAPDGFVVKGVPKLLPGGTRRRKYLLWEEGRVPCFVLEATSESTRLKDEKKKGIYEELGIEEYFQFDPLGEYLSPRLQGHRLVGGRYRALRPQTDGSLVSRTTGVVFRAEGSRLRLTDAATGAPLLRKEEEKNARLLAEETAVAEARARQKAEQARQQAEQALRQAEDKASGEATARQRAETARQQAEHRAAAEAAARQRAEQARQQAEDKARALEEELARLRSAKDSMR
jgi:Uma2 family endonuclease